MEQNIERARDMLPSIVITVLSMIQALALELYWTRLQESEFLWQGGWGSVIGWLQMALMLMGMVQIWLLYVSLMLRFSWLPTMVDTVLPFAIGLLQFSMIDLIGSEHLGIWFLALATIFGIAIGASHLAFFRARQDPVNDYYFSQMLPASWRDYLASVVIISCLALFGALLWWTGNRTGLALAAMVFALTALTYQLIITRRQWLLVPVRPEQGTDQAS